MKVRVDRRLHGNVVGFVRHRYPGLEPRIDVALTTIARLGHARWIMLGRPVLPWHELPGSGRPGCGLVDADSVQAQLPAVRDLAGDVRRCDGTNTAAVHWLLTEGLTYARQLRPLDDPLQHRS